MPDGVIGNTSDSGSEESRFEPWSGNLVNNNNKADHKSDRLFLLLIFNQTPDSFWGSGNLKAKIFTCLLSFNIQ